MRIQLRALVPMRRIAAAVMALASGLVIVSAQSSDTFVPVTDAMLEAPAPGDWLTWRRTPDGWGYSPLDQIDRDNVHQLRMVWSRGLAPGRQEGTPLAYDGVLYMQANDIIEAIDAVTGDLRWRHRRDLPDDLYDHVGANAAINRNIAIYDRFIINTSDDVYVFGLDAETGELAWETQIFDYTEISALHSSGPIIADGKAISGRSLRPARGVRHRGARRPHRGGAVAAPDDSGPGRAGMVTGVPGKTGVVYTLDRETGEFLWATPTVTQNVISAIDGATGAVTENAEVVFTAEGQEVFACPTWHGGKDWEASAYSPRTNMMYMPLRNTCARMMATRTFREDTPVGRNEARSPFYAIAYRHQLTPGTEFAGTVRAISAETGRTAWLHEQRAGTMSLVATGGGLVFGGDVNGRFRAFDDETGEVLWEINLGSAVTGFPISYAVDGRQYIAVGTGYSGTSGTFTALAPELRPSRGNNLFVFALP